jgi:hypothetical protein
MARKKRQAKPLFEANCDFMDSLINVCHQAVLLLDAIDTIMQQELPAGVVDLLDERRQALRAALISDE